MSTFIFDGVQAIQRDQIESVRPTTREVLKDSEVYGARSLIEEIEARIIRCISGSEYLSDGSYLDIIDIITEADDIDLDVLLETSEVQAAS